MKKLVLLAICFCGTIAFAQKAPQEVTLVVSADGATKTQAIDNALRSAIEQTFGTFVSANTEILNDELVMDEIATVSSGNIQKYKEIASVTLPNGKTSVTLNVIVSLKKLVKYAQSKGSECEFAGATFGANARMYEFNKKNEEIAIQNLIRQLDALRPVYDYEIEVSEPKMDKVKEAPRRAREKTVEKAATIEIQVVVKSNDKTKVFNELIQNTIMSLAMTEKQIKPMIEAGFEYQPYALCLDGKIDKIPHKNGSIYPRSKQIFFFYTKAIELLDWELNCAMYDFSIKDNNGNEFLLIDLYAKSDGFANGRYSIGHRFVFTPHDYNCVWGFQNVERGYNDISLMGKYLTKGNSKPVLNTHVFILNRYEYGSPRIKANGFFSLNTSRIVWITPKLSFKIPVEIIKNISGIKISPTTQESTVILVSENHFSEIIKRRMQGQKFDYFTLFNNVNKETENVLWIKGRRMTLNEAIKLSDERF